VYVITIYICWIIFYGKKKKTSVLSTKSRNEGRNEKRNIFFVQVKLYLFYFVAYTKFVSSFSVSHGVKLSPLVTSATIWPIVPAPDDRWWWWLWSNRWNANWQGKQKYSEKTCPSAILSTTNPTWMTRARTRAATVGSRRLTAWAMARPTDILPNFVFGFLVRTNWKHCALVWLYGNRLRQLSRSQTVSVWGMSLASLWRAPLVYRCNPGTELRLGLDQTVTYINTVAFSSNSGNSFWGEGFFFRPLSFAKNRYQCEVRCAFEENRSLFCQTALITWEEWPSSLCVDFGPAMLSCTVVVRETSATISAASVGRWLCWLHNVSDSRWSLFRQLLR
jgi:hypothetical protein